MPDQISKNLCPNKSVNPPKNPCMAPTKIPIVEENIVKKKAKIMEILKPYINLANTSLA